MGLEDLIDVTDDIGAADAILASSSEIRQNPWISGVAKFHKLPIFVIKVPSCCLVSCSFNVFYFCVIMTFGYNRTPCYHLILVTNSILLNEA